MKKIEVYEPFTAYQVYRFEVTEDEYEKIVKGEIFPSSLNAKYNVDGKIEYAEECNLPIKVYDEETQEIIQEYY